MIESLTINNNSLGKSILKYLDKKGKIKAALLHKLIKRFSESGFDNHKVSKDQLLSCLFFMMRRKKIEIIIPELFIVHWDKSELKDLRFLEDGYYLTRKYKTIDKNQLSQSNYYFDSREKVFENDDKYEDLIDRLRKLIREIPDLAYKTIIYDPIGNKLPLNIYEPFEGNYKINVKNILVPIKKINKLENRKIQIPLKQQHENLEIINSYRSKFMCFYITLLETLLKSIQDIQKQRDSKRQKKALNDLITKFACYCIAYVKSDLIEIKEPNPYRWQTFFQCLNIPLKIDYLDFKSINFYGRTFDTHAQLKYSILIDKNEKNLISYLKRLGYEELSSLNSINKIAIGKFHEIYFPCSTLEHMYFFTKYFSFYHLFLLFHNCFDHICKMKPHIKLTKFECDLYQVFYPVMASLFDVKDKNLNQRLIFKYYTVNSHELELIYNKYLIKNTRIIEKKLFKYYVLKFKKLNQEKL
ncbi:MAG: hypothetical protein GF353_28280 [Candidatus Lokiarchaeota archaeon]|nr:hypothetical protein [Candidatus Lokiarchaeota archaeon]